MCPSVAAFFSVILHVLFIHRLLPSVCLFQTILGQPQVPVTLLIFKFCDRTAAALGSLIAVCDLFFKFLSFWAQFCFDITYISINCQRRSPGKESKISSREKYHVANSSWGSFLDHSWCHGKSSEVFFLFYRIDLFNRGQLRQQLWLKTREPWLRKK